MFQGFLKYNSVKDWDSGKENPYYFDMHLSHSSSYSFVLSYDYGKLTSSQIAVQAP